MAERFVDVPPYRLTGTVYSALLNHRSSMQALGKASQTAPYGKEPCAPVVILKPRNTLCSSGDDITLPSDENALELGGSLAVVIGRTACRVPEHAAAGHIAGYLLANDVSVPVSSHYRPAVRHKSRDGFCAIADQILPPDAIDVATSEVQTFLDDALVQSVALCDLMRPVPRLIADISEFMTLAAGDVLLVSAAWPGPQARAGQCAVVLIEGMQSLTNRIVSERS